MIRDGRNKNDEKFGLKYALANVIGALGRYTRGY